MKKFSLASLIITALSVVLLFVGLIMIIINYKNSTSVASVLMPTVLLAAIGVFTIVIVVLNKCKLAIIIPVLGTLVVVPQIYPAVNNTTVIAYLVLALLIVSMVLAPKKNAKWASIVVITILALVIFQYLPTCTEQYKGLNQVLQIYANLDGATPSDALKASLYDAITNCALMTGSITLVVSYMTLFVNNLVDHKEAVESTEE